MAENPTKTAETESDKPTTHSKKAQMTAILMVIIVVLGLFINTWANMSKRDKRQAQQAEDTAAAEAKAQPRTAEAKLTDFAEKQQEAGREIEANHEVEKEKRSRETIMDAINGKGDAAASGSEAQPKQTLKDVEQEIALIERKRALQAGYGGLGRATSGGASAAQDAGQSRAPASNQDLIAGVDQRIAQLSSMPDSIAKQQRALIEKAQAAGVALPADIVARYAGGSTAQQGSGARQMATSAQPKGTMSFGELATNRAARDPAHSGPRPGEKILPTATVISAVLDTSMMSDYTGDWIAVLQRPVYDVELENILLPTGTKIFGRSARATEVNEALQSRMGSFPLWAIRPDGKRIDFSKAVSTDTEGVAALKGTVDRHFLAQFMGIGAYALIGIGPSMSNYGSEPQSSRDAFVREATGRSREVGRAFAEKYLNIVPTNRIPAGTPIKIILEDDLYITPWEDINASHFIYR